MASLTAMAEYPERIENLFLNKEASVNGVYAVQFYALGVPITIMVDDKLPFDKSDQTSTWFARIGDDGSLWIPIIEKAFSKFHGNYSRLELGDSVDGISTLNGSPNESLKHNKSSKEEVWNMLLTYDSDKHKGMLIATTPGESDT